MENVVEYIVINDKKYKKGTLNVENSGEAYFINNDWVLAENCVFDNSLKEYIIKNSGEINGIVSVNDDGKPVYGYFRPTLDAVSIYINSSTTVCMSEEIAKQLGCIRQNDNVYYHFSEIANVKNVYEPIRITQNLKSSYPYSATNFEKNIDYLKNMKLKITKRAKNISSLLGGLSYGLEFETIAGVLSEKELMENGLVALRDGSIEGLEYATVPLTGDSGLQTLYNAVSVLTDRTNVDHTCAMHFHIGNIPRTKSFIVALWVTIAMIQDDLYELQNSYKRDPRKFKRKNYSSPLPVHVLRNMVVGNDTTSVNTSFNAVMRYLGMGLVNDNIELKNITEHPADPDNSRKWNIKTRYSILNMIPLIFGNKATVEFRHHDISNNREDIIYELLFDLAIVKFVMDKEREILNNNVNINLTDILVHTYSNDSSLLDGLFKYRDAKRNFVCRSYLNGDHDIVSNVSNKQIASRLKLSVTDNNMTINKKIDFYNKYIRNKGVNIFNTPTTNTIRNNNRTLSARVDSFRRSIDINTPINTSNVDSLIYDTIHRYDYVNPINNAIAGDFDNIRTQITIHYPQLAQFYNKSLTDVLGDMERYSTALKIAYIMNYHLNNDLVRIVTDMDRVISRLHITVYDNDSTTTGNVSHTFHYLVRTINSNIPTGLSRAIEGMSFYQTMVDNRQSELSKDVVKMIMYAYNDNRALLAKLITDLFVLVCTRHDVSRLITQMIFSGNNSLDFTYRQLSDEFVNLDFRGKSIKINLNVDNTNMNNNTPNE